MTTITGTLTVNAAFLQEIKEDAREFRQLLCQAVDLLGPSQMPTADLRQVADVLGRLRDQLALHFTLEEAFGYFEDALDAAPQLSQRAEALRSEHQTLFVDLCAIVDLAERMVYGRTGAEDRTELGRMFHRFRVDIALHESREHDLILAALNDDIGCGD
jgi:hypothetical protein